MYKVTLQSNALVALPCVAALIARGVSTLKATAGGVGGGGVVPRRDVVRSTRKQRERKTRTCERRPAHRS